MKNKLAKFAVFQIFPSGADQIYASRDIHGKPLQTYEDAVARMNYHKSGIANWGELNLIVRSL